MNTITVKAAQGVRVPMEGAPKRHITESQPRTVPASAYYARRLADGDLVLADAADPAPDMASNMGQPPDIAPDAPPVPDAAPDTAPVTDREE